MIGPLERGVRRIRVWQDELPHIFAPNEVLRQNIPSINRSRFDHEVSIAVEMSVFTSPRFQYGLLGASFRPEGADNLLISIATSESQDQPFGESIGWKRDRIFWGLPKEHAVAISKVVMSSKAPIGTGRLDFQCAAHSEVTSNLAIFACLAQILMTSFEHQLRAESIAEVALQQSIQKSAALLGLDKPRR